MAGAELAVSAARLGRGTGGGGGTYAHGFTTIPQGIKGICLEATAWSVANPEGVRSETIGSYSITHSGAGGDLTGILPEAERRELNRYRRRAWS